MTFLQRVTAKQITVLVIALVPEWICKSGEDKWEFQITELIRFGFNVHSFRIHIWTESRWIWFILGYRK